MISSSYKHPYDNAYDKDNVYGKALKLLCKNRTPKRPNQIHLDLGCGFGRIAEPLVQELGVHYVGIDRDQSGLKSLEGRGFEVHQLTFDDEKSILEALREVVGDRSVSSLTMLDVLEHLPNGDLVLRAIQRLALENEAITVLSVPNVGHRDVGLKLLFGLWDYTAAGILDHTHVRFFTSAGFQGQLQAAGLHMIERDDVIHVQSDQHFPHSHSALAEKTLLSTLLRDLQERACSDPSVIQFVWACAPGPRMIRESFIQVRDADRPFLSIVIRTQGKRPHTLREVFVALAGQECEDFEVIVVGHRLTLEKQLVVERIIEDNPEWLRRKTRLIRVEVGNRTRPLNVGFQAATGQYISILDDDDIPLGHWVETFQRLARDNHGKLLRSVCVRQEIANVSTSDQLAVRTTGGPQKMYPSTFDFIENLRVNTTPPVALAFPRGVFHDLGCCFDETLTTTEDWDYILRVAAIVGVATSPEITCIYRWWSTEESSRTEHSIEEWQTNHRRIYDKLEKEIVLLPSGEISRIRKLLDERDTINALRHEMASLASFRDELTARLTNAQRENSLIKRENQLLLTSFSWQFTRPLRSLAAFVRRGPRRQMAIS